MSMKEAQRRAAVRARDILNAPWRTKAACNPSTGHSPPEVKTLPDFMAEDRYGQREAALFCNQHCTVVEECRNFAINTGERHYVWGGLTSTEREHVARKLRDERRKTQQS